jgi:hypothetical protein
MKIEIKAMIDRISNHNTVLIVFSPQYLYNANTPIFKWRIYTFLILGRLKELNTSVLNICANKLYIFICDFGSYIFFQF